MSLEDELRMLAKDRAGSRKLWSRCPDDLQIAAYVDGTVDGAVRQSLEQHFSDCHRCLDEVSFLVRADDWPAAENAPPWLLKKVESLGGTRRKTGFKFDWRWATATVAVAFAVTFVVLLAVRLRPANSTTDSAAISSATPVPTIAANATPSPEQQNPGAIAQSSSTGSPPIQKRDAPPITRRTEATSGLPNFLSLHDGSVLKRGALVFNWQKVPDVAFYEIWIMTPTGAAVITSQSETESINLSGDVRLQAGAKYFASVHAHLRDGRTIRSIVVPFTVTD